MLFKAILRFALALILGAILIPVASAQTGMVKGFAKDQQGKPMVGAMVEFAGQNAGGHYKLKTDKKGEYYSLGIRIDTYNVTLYGPDGKKIWNIPNQAVHPGQELAVNFDMAKEYASAKTQQEQQITPEQKKAIEEAEKANQKIKASSAVPAESSPTRIPWPCRS